MEAKCSYPEEVTKFLKTIGYDTDDVIELVNLRIEVPSWQMYIAHLRVLQSFAQFEHSHSVTVFNTISIVSDSMLFKGWLITLNDYPKFQKDDPTEDKFSFEKPIPSLEVPVVEDSAHPKGAQNGESQPQ